MMKEICVNVINPKLAQWDMFPSAPHFISPQLFSRQLEDKAIWVCIGVRVPTTSEGKVTVSVMEIEGERVDNS